MQGSVRKGCGQGALPTLCPVKLFMGILLSAHMDLEEVKPALTGHFGPIDHESPLHPFDHTDYYAEEMGTGLRRYFVSFYTLVSPGELVAIKNTTNGIEMHMGKWRNETVHRQANLDPGLLSLSNIILATTKNRAHRIYLSQGIFAEVTLMYSKKGGWQPLQWTYPDYRTPLAMEFFKRVRALYRTQVRIDVQEAEGY